MKTVGILGGAGFIGSYTTKKFLDEGYRVKVSTRDLSTPERFEHLKELPGASHLEIREVDVRDERAVLDFLKGCQLIVHGGTPFQLDIKDVESELFDPIVNGTRSFLNSLGQVDEVEKIVFLASVASLNTNFPLLPGTYSKGDVITVENTKFFSEDGHPYGQAKFLAHQAVEQFISEHPDLPFEITTLSPVGVMGKPLSKREDSTSAGLQYLWMKKIAPNPFVQMMFDDNIYFAMVDVEDVAEALYQATVRKGLHGKNLLIAKESYRISDINRMLNHERPEAEPVVFYDGSLAEKELGITCRPAELSLNSYSA